METIRVGVSACLLGREVRYDGSHKLDWYLVHVLGQWVELVPVCPEAECSLGIPREPMRLERQDGRIRLISIRTRRDLTETMMRWVERRVESFAQEKVHGFVLKSKSPSCGPRRVNIFEENQATRRKGSGLFAKKIMERFPHLPVMDEQRLTHPAQRENFVQQLFHWSRWERFLAEEMSISRLAAFHLSHRHFYASRDASLCRRMDVLIREFKGSGASELYEAYFTHMVQVLRKHPTRAKNAQVLRKMIQSVHAIPSAEKKELLDTVSEYRKENLPLLVPLTLVKHAASRYGGLDLSTDVYFNPSPKELALLSHP